MENIKETNTDLIVMLTYNDMTVENANEIFQQCKESSVKYWGFKEAGLPLPQMKDLCEEMRKYGKTTFLEVVAYTEEEGLESAQIAVDCGFDVLMGTIFSEKILDFCNRNSLRYMPFVGEITGRPSVLQGDADEIVAEANEYVSKGAYGIDLLGYRYVGDASNLIRRVVKEVSAPVCVAGSIDSYERLDEIKSISPWAFTIGSAFFNHKFGDGFDEQVEKVKKYIS